MTYRIEGEWLVDDVEECTCGGSGILSPSHQPGCGSEPLAKIEDILRDYSLLSQVKQALAAAEARIEAVKARAAFESAALNVAYRRGFNNAMGQIRAALSVAPQPQPDPIGKPCAIAPAVGGLVYDRNDARCWHEGGLWHDLSVAPQPQPAREADAWNWGGEDLRPAALQPPSAATEARLEAARAWLARIEPYPERNGDHFRELREILGP